MLRRSRSPRRGWAALAYGTAGKWYNIIGIVNVASDSISIYVNNVLAVTTAVTFANATFDAGVRTNDKCIAADSDAGAKVRPGLPEHGEDLATLDPLAIAREMLEEIHSAR